MVSAGTGMNSALLPAGYGAMQQKQDENSGLARNAAGAQLLAAQIARAHTGTPHTDADPLGVAQAIPNHEMVLGMQAMKLGTMSEPQMQRYLARIEDPNTPLAKSRRMANLFNAPANSAKLQEAEAKRYDAWGAKPPAHTPLPGEAELAIAEGEHYRQLGQEALTQRQKAPIQNNFNQLLDKPAFGRKSRFADIVLPDRMLEATSTLEQGEAFNQKLVELYTRRHNPSYADLGLPKHEQQYRGLTLDKAQQQLEAILGPKHQQAEAFKQKLVNLYADGPMPKGPGGKPMYQQWDDATRLKHAQLQFQQEKIQLAELNYGPSQRLDDLLKPHRNDLATFNTQLKDHRTPAYQAILDKQAQHAAKLASPEVKAAQAQYKQQLTQQEELLNKRINLNNQLTKTWPWQDKDNRADLRDQLNKVKAEEAQLRGQSKPAVLNDLDALAQEAHLPGTRPNVFQKALTARAKFDNHIVSTLKVNYARALTSRNPLVKYPAKTAAAFENVMGKVITKGMEAAEFVLPGSSKVIMKALPHLGTAAVAWEGLHAGWEIAHGNTKNAAMDLTGLATGAMALAPIAGLLATGATGGLGLIVIPAIVGGLGAWAGRETIGKAIVNTFGLSNKEDRDEAQLDEIAKEQGIDRKALEKTADGQPAAQDDPAADPHKQAQALAYITSLNAGKGSSNAFALNK